jgi:hypothetical protein
MFHFPGKDYVLQEMVSCRLSPSLSLSVICLSLSADVRSANKLSLAFLREISLPRTLKSLLT